MRSLQPPHSNTRVARWRIVVAILSTFAPVAYAGLHYGYSGVQMYWGWVSGFLFALAVFLIIERGRTTNA